MRYEISKNTIYTGLHRGVIKYAIDPTSKDEEGIVCKIGDSWFYFTSVDFEHEKDIDAFIAATDEDDNVNDIYENLIAIQEEYPTEYEYMYNYLKTNLGDDFR